VADHLTAALDFWPTAAGLRHENLGEHARRHLEAHASGVVLGHRFDGGRAESVVDVEDREQHA
jgi:hypothetical protein